VYHKFTVRFGDRGDNHIYIIAASFKEIVLQWQLTQVTSLPLINVNLQQKAEGPLSKKVRARLPIGARRQKIKHQTCGYYPDEQI
jgi:hypothetical protein